MSSNNLKTRLSAFLLPYNIGWSSFSEIGMWEIYIDRFMNNKQRTLNGIKLFT